MIIKVKLRYMGSHLQYLKRLHTTGRGAAARWSVLLGILGLSLLDEALLVLVFPLRCCELGGSGKSGLVVETVEDAGTEGRVAEHLDMSVSLCGRTTATHCFA